MELQLINYILSGKCDLIYFANIFLMPPKITGWDNYVNKEVGYRTCRLTCMPKFNEVDGLHVNGKKPKV